MSGHASLFDSVDFANSQRLTAFALAVARGVGLDGAGGVQHLRTFPFKGPSTVSPKNPAPRGLPAKAGAVTLDVVRICSEFKLSRLSYST
jgi:hypothetical protein